jgi:outer membrane cobalamin receptor
MKTSSSWITHACLLCAAFAGVASSHAVEPASETSPSRTIVVTATRQDVPRLDYPGSISRIDRETISAAGATHHGEVMNRAPGTLIQRGSGQESLTAIRSPVLTGPGSCGAFLFLEDGIPIRPTGFCNVNDLFEVNSEQAEAIEVLRGPGSALYGSKDLHGIVNVIMPEPSQLPPWALALETGSDDYRRARLAWSHVGGDTDFSAVGHYTQDGGFREDSGFDEGKLSAAMVHRAAGGVLRVRFSGTVLNQETAGFIQGFEAYRNAEARRSNVNPEAFRDAHSLRASAHWQAPVAGDAEFNARLVARSSRMHFLQHFLLGKPLEENGQDSIAALLAWNIPWSDHTRLIAGADAEYSLSSLLEFQSGPPPTARRQPMRSGRPDAITTTKSMAPAWRPTRRWSTNSQSAGQ